MRRNRMGTTAPREAAAARPAAKPGASLKATAVRMLARREYGRVELADRLIARGGSRDEVAAVLDELERLGYLSDARFAHAVVTQKAGQYGKRAIVHALKERRVAPAAAEAALRALDGIDELAQATALWQRRFGVLPRDERDKARQLRFLCARGFGMSVALKVLRVAGTAGAVDTDAD